MNVTRGRERCKRTGKLIYVDEAEAKKATKYVRKRTKAKLYPYRCPHCLGWHMGHHRNIKNILHVLYTRNTQPRAK